MAFFVQMFEFEVHHVHAFCECVCMLGCTTVPMAPYHMLSSVGTWSPLDNVILQWLTPVQGCGNQLDPTDYPGGGDVVSSISGLSSLPSCFDLHYYITVALCHGPADSPRCEMMKLLGRNWDLYLGDHHAHTVHTLSDLKPSTHWTNGVPHAAVSAIT